MKMSNESLFKKREEGSCPVTVCEKSVQKYMDVSIPVDIKPNVTVELIEARCCGDPIVECSQSCGNTCKINITQKLYMDITVCYDIGSCIGDSSVSCFCDD